MQRMNQGFSVAIVLVALVVIAGVVGVGYSFLHSDNKGSSRSSAVQSSAPPTSLVTFKHPQSFDPRTKQQIMDQIVNPLITDQEQVLHLKLQYVTVDVDKNAMGAEDDRFLLGYRTADAPSESGFVFGANHHIGYYQPVICDEGGCMSYPELLKQKFPANYQNYLACQSANNAGDKEQANIVCAM